MVKVKDIMIRDLVVVASDFSLETVDKVMKSKGIGHVFVVDQGELQGIISNGDVNRRRSHLAGTEFSTAREEQTLKIKAHQFMTRKLFSLSEDATLSEAIDLLLKNDIHCVPVLNSRGRLSGVLTGTDLLRHMRKMLEI